MGIIRYKQKNKNIVKLIQYLNDKYVDTKQQLECSNKLLNKKK